ncbi:MAG: tRNA-dihydrouridine synthase family protein, partial [Halobacteriales archaeon]|nr:tRNA-dihydrouridine synthase family protein [Halobacteriales archaeon]
MGLLRPLRIGRARLPNNLVLSPMAGYTDLPFRVLCRDHGAGLVCTEMVAAQSWAAGGHATRLRARTMPGERPVSIQIVGREPDSVGFAAAGLGADCDILGLNMGCPAHQVARAGCGSALLDEPALAEDLVRAVKANSDTPLLVKMRVGTRRVMDVEGFARMLERAGADGLIVHGRTAAQSYSGKADWGLIRAVKESVGIPVIGNGDVGTGPDAARALDSGCDGIAIGRAALGDPHVFHRIAHFLGHGDELPLQTPDERAADFRRYLALIAELGHEETYVQTQAQAFSKGLPGASRLRAALHMARTG